MSVVVAGGTPQLQGQSASFQLKLGIESLTLASGCDSQFVGQWTVTDRYGGQLGSLSKAWVVSYVNTACA